MPLWVIGFLVGCLVSGVRYEIKVHHKAPERPAMVELDQVAAKKFLDCVSAASIAAGSPATLDCMEVYTNGRTQSN
jgi:hypothetical protein